MNIQCKYLSLDSMFALRATLKKRCRLERIEIEKWKIAKQQGRPHLAVDSFLDMEEDYKKLRNEYARLSFYLRTNHKSAFLMQY